MGGPIGKASSDDEGLDEANEEMRSIVRSSRPGPSGSTYQNHHSRDELPGVCNRLDYDTTYRLNIAGVGY